MMHSTPNTLTSISVSTYGLILQAYPSSFRREFGDSMRQVFRDAVQDAWRRSGVSGVAILWMRTVADVVTSLFRAYLDERREPLFKLTVSNGILFVVALTAMVVYGAVTYREFYEPPSFVGRFGAPAAHEDALIAGYEQALTGAYGRYRTFAGISAIVFTIWLGISSALFGLWQRSLLHGAGALVAGCALMVAALSLLPSIWFPLDGYPPAALWVMGGAPVLAFGVWLIASFIGRVGPSRV
jgi:hypothetical protein